MKKTLIILISSLFIIISASEVNALGGYLTGDYGQVAPVEIKAIIDFDGETEKITASQTFIFNPLNVTNFYWVMAFPVKAEVKKPDSKKNMLNDIFLDLEKKTVKKFNKDNIFNKLLYPDIIEEKTESYQSFSRMMMMKYVKEVPEFKDIKELEKWFKNNAYPIPKNSRELFKEYIDKGWHFTLAVMDGSHITMDATETLTMNGAHTIPVTASFRTDKIIYPLKMVNLQPDRDSQAIPFSFPYGSKSEDVLGTKDKKIDYILSTQSPNMFSPLVLDLMPVKIDLFVRAKYKVEIKGFTTVYANKEGGKYLTRILGYRPMTQLEDVVIVKANDQRRINPHVSVIEKFVRGLIVGILIIYFLRKLKANLRLKTIISVKRQ